MSRDQEGTPMEPGMIIAGGHCGENDCPTISCADNGMVDVQGYYPNGISAPVGETVARIPAQLIIDAARALITESR
jgi:hypothetical protein